MAIRRIELFLITALSTVLVACGGGGDTSQVASVGAASVSAVDSSGVTASPASFPSSSLSSGTYRHAELQTLYDALTARSKSSLIEALKVGVEIEEHDIYGITAQKANVDNADILTVYDSLLLSSRPV